MELWFSHLLVAGLVLTTSALTPEECQPLIKPLSLADSSMLPGRQNMIMAYSDNKAYNAMLNITESFWMKMAPSPSNSRELILHEENKINGSCIGLSYNMTVEGDTLKMSLSNISAVFHLLPGCDGCSVLLANSTVRNLDKLLRQLNINIDVPSDEITTQGFYLMVRETAVKDSDLEQFKQQASCLGFTGEPGFTYDPKNDFCAEGEGSHLSLS